MWSQTPEAVHAQRIRAPVGLADMLDRAVLRMNLISHLESLSYRGPPFNSWTRHPTIASSIVVDLALGPPHGRLRI